MKVNCTKKCIVYFIYNPNAGNKSNGYRQKLINRLKKIPNSTLLLTDHANHAHELTLQILPANPSKIIAIGGDGTLNEIGNALIGTQIPLGIIPLGSGNGLARHLKIPMNPNKALHVALDGSTKAIDVLTWNNRALFCTAGIGFDAYVASIFQHGKGRGFMNYINSAFKALFKFKPVDISFEHEKTSYFSLTFANANQFGNNAYISPLSNLQDALFEVVKIKKGDLWQIGKLGISLFLKNIHRHKLVEIQQANSYNFRVPIGTSYHLDGESLETENEEIIIKILVGQLQVIA